MRVRVKFCGVTRLPDALAAVELGVDALGFVFWPTSPRSVTAEAAAAIIAALPPFVAKVGLFVDQGAGEVARIARASGIDTLQFHGQESPEYCRAMRVDLGFAYIKAVPMRTGINVAAELAIYEDAAAFLLDTYKPGVVGGTGESFPWQQIPVPLPRPIVLAGGIGIDNVAEAIRCVRPYAVDVSTGIELDKRHKDISKMRSFMREVRSVGTAA